MSTHEKALSDIIPCTFTREELTDLQQSVSARILDLENTLPLFGSDVGRKTMAEGIVLLHKLSEKVSKLANGDKV